MPPPPSKAVSVFSKAPMVPPPPAPCPAVSSEQMWMARCMQQPSCRIDMAPMTRCSGNWVFESARVTLTQDPQIPDVFYGRLVVSPAAAVRNLTPTYLQGVDSYSFLNARTPGLPEPFFHLPVADSDIPNSLTGAASMLGRALLGRSPDNIGSPRFLWLQDHESFVSAHGVSANPASFNHLSPISNIVVGMYFPPIVGANDEYYTMMRYDMRPVIHLEYFKCAQ